MRRRPHVPPRPTGWMRILPLLHETFTHETPDGTLRAWDVTEGNRIARQGHHILIFSLKDRNITPETVLSLYEGIDLKRAETADLTRPLLFVPLGEEGLLIDGNHRLYRAAELGVEELPMRQLTQEEADAIQWLHLPPGHGIDWREDNLPPSKS